MFEITGTVSDYDELLRSFSIDWSILVYIAEDTNVLPVKDAVVTIKSSVSKAFDDGRVIILKPDDLLEFDIAIVIDQERIFDEMDDSTKFKFGRVHLHLTHYTVTCQPEIMAYVAEGLKEQLNVKLLFDVYDMNERPGRSSDYWSIRTKHSVANDLLVGYISVDGHYGNLLFSDLKVNLPLILIHATPADRVKLCYNYVTTPKYVLVTEFYKCEPSLRHQYIIVDARGLTVIASQEDSSFEQLESYPLPGYVNAEFKVLAKSGVSKNRSGSNEFWIKAEFATNLQMLCFRESEIKLNQIFEVGSQYRIHYKRGSKRTVLHNRDISSVTSHKQFLIPNETKFSVASMNETATYMSASAAAGKLNSKSLVTFTGKLLSKKFVKPLPSKTVPVTTSPAFGTPGSKTHKLTFETSTSRSLSVYLNDFENMVVPIGIIPGMILTVHNVMAHREKYYKSTALTTIVPVTYNK